MVMVKAYEKNNHRHLSDIPRIIFFRVTCLRAATHRHAQRLGRETSLRDSEKTIYGWTPTNQIGKLHAEG